MTGRSTITTPAPTPRRRATALVALGACLILAACSGERQDTHEPSANFPVQVTQASFPAAQNVSGHYTMVISVKNAGRQPVPDIAVSVCPVTCQYPAPPGEGTSSAVFDSNTGPDSLDQPTPPIWIVDRPPGPCTGVHGYSCASGGAGGDTTDAPNTWAAGRLQPGATATFVWHVTAITAGRQVVGYSIGAGLAGKAKAIVQGGGTPTGQFTVNISQAPRQSYVNDAGQIVYGRPPTAGH